MGFFTKDIKTLDDLFVHTLRDIYYAEQQIAKSLPDMIEKATDQALRNGFETHLAETNDQIVRLEKVFRMHGVEAKGVDCPAIDGILDEASEVAGDVDDKSVLDAALIAAAQAVEHYEITRYGTLIAWANMLGRSDCASVLQQNLDAACTTILAAAMVACPHIRCHVRKVPEAEKLRGSKTSAESVDVRFGENWRFWSQSSRRPACKPVISHIRLSPRSPSAAQARKWQEQQPHVQQTFANRRLQVMCPACLRGTMTAGPDVIRGSGPNQSHGLVRP